MPLYGQIYYKEALMQTAGWIFGSLLPHLDIVCEVLWQKRATDIKGLFWLGQVVIVSAPSVCL